MPALRPKKRKTEQDGPNRQRQRQQQQHNAAHEEKEGERQQADTAPLSPRRVGHSTDAVVSHSAQQPPQPVPVEQLNLSSLSSSAVAASSLSSVPTPASSLSAPSAARAKAKLYVVLVKAGLETIKTKTGYELVTADTHSSLLLRLKRDPSEFRPDIVHQCLLTLLDSPLNKAGLLQVLVQTDNNVLIEVNPSTRIPRTFKRFAGLMGHTTHHTPQRHATAAYS